MRNDIDLVLGLGSHGRSHARLFSWPLLLIGATLLACSGEQGLAAPLNGKAGTGGGLGGGAGIGRGSGLGGAGGGAVAGSGDAQGSGGAAPAGGSASSGSGGGAAAGSGAAHGSGGAVTGAGSTSGAAGGGASNMSGGAHGSGGAVPLGTPASGGSGGGAAAASGGAAAGSGGAYGSGGAVMGGASASGGSVGGAAAGSGGAYGSGGAATGGASASGGSASAGQWRTSELVETDDAGDAYIPRIVVDPSGNAIAVWFQSDGTRRNIWANRFVPGAGWGTATLIETNNGGPAENPQIAVDPSGNATAVWEQQSDGDHYGVWANRFVPGSGWGTATVVQTNNSVYARNPQIAVDASGNATAVWTQTEGVGIRHDTWANRFVPGSGWGTPTLLGTDNDGLGDYRPQVAVDPAGNVTVVWEQSAETFPTLWTNRFVPGSGWGTATILVPASAGSASGSRVAVDPAGNVTVVWNQSDAIRSHVWANRYLPGSGWGTATQVDTNAVSAVSPQIAVDASGTVIAVWNQFDGTSTRIWARHYVLASGWGTAKLLETDVGESWVSEIAVNGSGTAIAIWNQSDGTRFNVWANRYVPGLGWGTATLIETDNAGHASSATVAVAPLGDAIAVWSQSNGSRFDIWANTFR